MRGRLNDLNVNDVGVACINIICAAGVKNLWISKNLQKIKRGL
jgi:hypothetical protein